MVSPFQYIESTRMGKLTEAATPKVSATRKAMFWSLNRMPSTTATMPMPTEAIRDTRRSSRASALPFFTTIT
ncbi:hypothetical protein D3C81_1855950 [compost metagenome]